MKEWLLKLPKNSSGLKVYLGADFDRMHGYKVIDDSVCVMSRTCCVIMVTKHSIMWHVSIKVAIWDCLVCYGSWDYCLAHSYHRLFPIMNGVSAIDKAIYLPIDNSTIQVAISSCSGQNFVTTIHVSK